MLLQYTFLSSRKSVVSVRDWSGFYCIYKQPLPDILCQRVVYASPMLYVEPPQNFRKVTEILNYRKQTEIIEIFPVKLISKNRIKPEIKILSKGNGKARQVSENTCELLKTKCVYTNVKATQASIPA